MWISGPTLEVLMDGSEKHYSNNKSELMKET